MNRKELEQCAWAKTPEDERRDRDQRYDWQTKKSVVVGLTGNEREVLVFDPSGTTEGTMIRWVPLWSLFPDELEQRCVSGRQPKLRSPYHRTRSDYTGDVESDGPHTTRPKSSSQLKREVTKILDAKRRILDAKRRK